MNAALGGAHCISTKGSGAEPVSHEAPMLVAAMTALFGWTAQVLSGSTPHAWSVRQICALEQTEHTAPFLPQPAAVLPTWHVSLRQQPVQLEALQLLEFEPPPVLLEPASVPPQALAKRAPHPRMLPRSIRRNMCRAPMPV